MSKQARKPEPATSAGLSPDQLREALASLFTAPIAPAPAAEQVRQDNDREPVVYTVEEFCDAHKMSRTTFFKLRRAGKGPTVKELGNKLLISRESAQAWRNAE